MACRDLVASTNENDVVLGRGKRTWLWVGNVNFRKLVATKASSYLTCHSLERNRLAREIMESIHATGGRFLRPILASNKKGEVLGAWEIVSEETAIAKVKQALRDTSDESRKSKSKKRPCGRVVETKDQLLAPANILLHGAGSTPPTTDFHLRQPAIGFPSSIALRQHLHKQQQQPFLKVSARQATSPLALLPTSKTTFCENWHILQAQHELKRQQQQRQQILDYSLSEMILEAGDVHGMPDHLAQNTASRPIGSGAHAFLAENANKCFLSTSQPTLAPRQAAMDLQPTPHSSKVLFGTETSSKNTKSILRHLPPRTTHCGQSTACKSVCLDADSFNSQSKTVEDDEMSQIILAALRSAPMAEITRPQPHANGQADTTVENPPAMQQLLDIADHNNDETTLMNSAATDKAVCAPVPKEVQVPTTNNLSSRRFSSTSSHSLHAISVEDKSVTEQHRRLVGIKDDDEDEGSISSCGTEELCTQMSFAQRSEDGGCFSSGSFCFSGGDL